MAYKHRVHTASRKGVGVSVHTTKRRSKRVSRRRKRDSKGRFI